MPRLIQFARAYNTAGVINGVAKSGIISQNCGKTRGPSNVNSSSGKADIGLTRKKNGSWTGNGTASGSSSGN